MATGQFKYDKRSGQYTYSWNTKGIARGSYVLNADLGDGVAHNLSVIVN